MERDIMSLLSQTFSERVIMSVKEANGLLLSDVGQSLGGKIYRQIAEYITDPNNNVYGTAGEYHNIINAYLGVGDYWSAKKICDYALEKKPYNIDLLANAIRAASAMGEFDIVWKYIEKAEQIDYKLWNWRLFLFGIHAYKEYLSACMPGDENSVWETAIKLVHKYQECFPTDERAWNAEAELQLEHNNVKDAGEILYRAIFQPVDVDGEYKPMLARHCCVTYIDKILEDTEDYDMIIRVAKKGIQNTAEEQPSSEIGYFIYRMAMANDAKCIKENYDNEGRIEETLRLYENALQLVKEEAFTATISKRYAILQQHVKDEQMKKKQLVKRQLIVSPAVEPKE